MKRAAIIGTNSIESEDSEDDADQDEDTAEQDGHAYQELDEDAREQDEIFGFDRSPTLIITQPQSQGLLAESEDGDWRTHWPQEYVFTHDLTPGQIITPWDHERKPHVCAPSYCAHVNREDYDDEEITQENWIHGPQFYYVHRQNIAEY